MRSTFLKFGLIYFIIINIAVGNTFASNVRGKNNPTCANISPRELESFLDGFFDKYMSELNVPGATFVMVKDGEIFFSKGYGLADIEKQLPVYPEKTIFRAASIAKLFTATAIMQLVEQNKINLNENVNIYLSDFKIKNNYSTPITVANLLTHTTGFDYEITGMANLDKSKVKSLGEYLSSKMPDRIYPSNYLISYSNYGFTLAGYIVEQVSGMPFSEYIDKNILDPLGMMNSGFSLLPKTSANIAQGYVFKKNKFQRMPFEYYYSLPASSFFTTASDIANFMIAHLQNGRFENTRILESTIAKEMHNLQFTHHPDLPGFAYAFCEYYYGRNRFLFHEGEVAGFKSILMLNPENNLGFFLSTNCEPTYGAGGAISNYLRDSLLKILFPKDNSIIPVRNAENLKSNIEQLTGNYRYIRYSRNTLTKVDMLFADVRVEMDDNGYLLVNSQKYIQTSPMLFQHISGNINRSLTFSENNNKSFMFIWHQAFEKLRWYEKKDIQIGIIIFCFILFIASPIIWSVQTLIRRKRKQSPLPSVMVNGHWVAGIMCVLNISLLTTLAIFKSQFIGIEIVWHIPVTFKVALLIAIFSSTLTIITLIYTWIIFRNKMVSVVSKIHYSLVTGAGIGFTWFLYYWNLLGFQLE